MPQRLVMTVCKITLQTHLELVCLPGVKRINMRPRLIITIGNKNRTEPLVRYIFSFSFCERACVQHFRIKCAAIWSLQMHV